MVSGYPCLEYGIIIQVYTDLFLALRDDNPVLPNGDRRPRNPRGHPLLAALAYAFCPAAAGWWLAGADPEAPYDLAWKTLADCSRGISLKDSLVEMGLETYVGDVRKQVERIENLRSRFSQMKAPELSSLFTNHVVDINARFGGQEAVNRFFNSKWGNLIEYGRIWAFVIDDWKAVFEPEFKFRKNIKILLTGLSLNLPGVSRKPVWYPAWKFHLKVGHAQRIFLGFMVDDDEGQDQVRFALAANAGTYDDKPWEVTPELYALNRRTGAALPYKPNITPRYGKALIGTLAEFARSGPYPPQRALNRPQDCSDYCGFYHLCYHKRSLTDNVLTLTRQKQGIAHPWTEEES